MHEQADLLHERTNTLNYNGISFIIIDIVDYGRTTIERYRCFLAMLRVRANPCDPDFGHIQNCVSIQHYEQMSSELERYQTYWRHAICRTGTTKGFVEHDINDAPSLAYYSKLLYTRKEWLLY
jgi:hypothetical protein